MKVPPKLQSLVSEGLIDSVVRQLMSGKEATVYVVRCGEEVRCAKVYKDANHRSFRQSAVYREGRKVKDSRQARAMARGTRFGKQALEEEWQNVEIDTLHRLAAAGVRVPKPYSGYQGVILMDLVVDADGHAAPRVADVELSEEQALAYHALMIQQIVLMLCAGTIHGDLSEFNLLMAADGPVIIDLPQAVDASANNNSEALLLRDVENMKVFFGRFAPALAHSQYGPEIWSLYKAGALHPNTVLTGHFKADTRPANVSEVVREISAVEREHEALLEYRARQRQS